LVDVETRTLRTAGEQIDYTKYFFYTLGNVLTYKLSEKFHSPPVEEIAVHYS